ncbi:MAG: S-layer homology domain-containing protein [Lachnospiraceae bacterium]|nr:S-layer homology domain-containing protein [Lachnospiraceae bacterium]
MKQKYVKKCLALLAAGMMTVSSLSMGSLPVLAADGTEDEVVTYAEEVPEEEILSDEVIEVAADIDDEPEIEEADTAAEEVAAPTGDLTGKNGTVYVLMNIPYAEFYAAEGDSAVDAVSSATKNKPRTIGLSGGSYHVTREGTDITGVTYPVKVNDPSVLEGLTEITDTDSVDITVTNRGTTTTTTFTGKDVLYESPSYAYYVLDEVPASYKEVTYDGSTFTFGAATGQVTTVDGLTGTVKIGARHANIEIALNGVNIPTTTDADGNPVNYDVNAIVVTDEDGNVYGLRHIANLWRRTEIGWNYDEAGLGNLTGGIIKNIRYYFSDGSITDYPCDIGFRVAAYNKDAAAPALIKEDEQTDEQYTTYLGAINKVTVDGTEYDNAEPVIIAPDGTIDLAAKKDGKKVFANAKRHEVKVEAAAHDDLEFMIGGFTDVQDPSHAFFKEIYWAADLGITKGYSDGTFGINRSCTRGEAIMFLWRLAGKPSPRWAKSKFSDVSKSNPFYKAILWAEQKGITKGFADGTFGINKPCTRGQIMTFIWRCKNKPKPKAAAKSPFKDVAKNHPYYKAILWASQNGVAKGFSDGTYGINKACTRGQMMKFFYNLEN